MRLVPALTCLSLLGACADPYPRSDLTESDRAATYPALLPVEDVRATVPAPRITPETGSELDARAERLRARAVRLRAPVIDAATHDRMQRDVNG
ncbi:hypothetical protein [Roseovarius autotrophicus]|uniref:hypothetical protein n=1 Tax=Roseovarius autotrophicus TaxID=2824121 RepID=UPI001A0D324F|nr:hypothetical protein [Roseovarius autotrophicus]MBE0452263.1 hypothetical protein [Roseovarius sp.]